MSLNALCVLENNDETGRMKNTTLVQNLTDRVDRTKNVKKRCANRYLKLHRLQLFLR